MSIKGKDPFFDDLLDTKVSIKQHQMEQQRRKLEDLQRYILDTEESPRGYQSPPDTVERIDNEINKLNETIKKQVSEIAALEKSKEFIKNLKFTEGDAAFHKQYGNVIVRRLQLNYYDNSLSMYYVVGRDGERKVPVNELVPITEATKALFGKNK